MATLLGTTIGSRVWIAPATHVRKFAALTLELLPTVEGSHVLSTIAPPL
jgi:hypothetical protein